MPSQEYNLIHILRILKKWRNHILIISFAAMVFTALFSWFFLDDYYLSYARLYPVNMAYTDRSTMFNMNGGVDIPYFGDKDDVSRVLTTANSAELAQMLIKKYDLVKHYKIDTTKKYWRTKVQKEFESNYKVVKTEQGAIELSILDTDPQLAKQMIDDAISITDEINRNTVNMNKVKQIELFDNLNYVQTMLVQKNADSLAKLAKEYHIIARSVGGSEMIEGEDFNAVQNYKVLASKQKDAVEQLNNNMDIRQQIKSSLDANSLSLSVIEKPSVADRKEKPKRSIIVLIAGLLALAASVFGVLTLEEIKDIRTKI
jgi:uncharacterized protein involved in exopolysaccharide biosynthesis